MIISVQQIFKCLLKSNMINKTLYKMTTLEHKQDKQMKAYKTTTTSSSLALIVLCLTIPLVITALILTSYISSVEFGHTIFIEADKEPLNIVNKKFLSLGLDSSVITDGFVHFNMTDQKLIRMIQYLSPAYLRIGGNAADQLVFCEAQESEDNNCTLRCENCKLNQSDIFILSGSNWLKLHNLAITAGIDVIFDLNSLLRYENGSWNSENAIQMIQFSENNGLVLDWELGNEPNSYNHKFNTIVDPTQLGIDYRYLRNILNRYELYKNSYLVGPSTTRLRTKEIQDYFTKFLISGAEVVSAITWHHYYFSGMNSTPSEFLDPTIFNYLYNCIEIANSIARDLLQLKQSMWLGETSSAWHSGAPNLSDRFIACFIWIDKLGLSAQMGIDVVVRQSIFKGHYALLNDSYFPNPDWWLSVLYNRVVGTTVIRYTGDNTGKIRLYAHCAKNSSLETQHSSVVVFGVNLQNKPGFVKVENFKADSDVRVYEVTSESSLFSQYVRLNGQVLSLLPNLDLPELKPKIIVRETVFTMPAYSIVFWVFTNTNVRACAI